MKIWLLGVVVICLGVIAFALHGAYVHTHEDAIIRLRKDQTATTEIDFGDVFAGQQVSRTLVVQNGSSSEMMLDGKVGCGCTRVRLQKATLGAGATSKMIVDFDTSKIGQENALEHFILIERSTDSGENPKPLLQAIIRATVRPSIIMDRAALVWRFSPPGVDLTEESIRVRNRTDRSLMLKLAKAGNESDFFAISPKEFTLAPQKEINLYAKVTQRLEDRPYGGKIVIVAKSNDGIPAPLSLERFLDVEAVPKRDIEVSPGSIILGAADFQGRGGVAMRTVTLSVPEKVGITVTNVVSSSTSITVSRMPGNQFDITVARPSGRFLNEHVTFRYRSSGHDGTLDVPVMGIF